MTRGVSLILSCEHAGNTVPQEYKHLFRGHRELLRTHRGYDPGALDLARFLSRRLGAPLIAHTITRLLAEPNRSPGHRILFSEVTAPLDPAEKTKILERWYYPHRNAVEKAVRSAIALPVSRPPGQGGASASRTDPPPATESAPCGQTRLVVHIGVHTFTPVLHGEVRRADAGLLYDPGRRRELLFCLQWRRAWSLLDPDCVIRRNYPYRGAADSLVTYLRRLLPASQYLGLELEVNQRHLCTDEWNRLKEGCAGSLEDALLRARRLPE